MGMEFRPCYLSKEWGKQGHQVCIVGGSYSHLRKNQPRVPQDFTIEIIDGFSMNRRINANKNCCKTLKKY